MHSIVLNYQQTFRLKRLSVGVFHIVFWAWCSTDFNVFAMQKVFELADLAVIFIFFFGGDSLSYGSQT